MSSELRKVIASAPMFDGLDEVYVDFLAAQSRMLVLPAGQVLFRRGTPSTGFTFCSSADATAPRPAATTTPKSLTTHPRTRCC